MPPTLSAANYHHKLHLIPPAGHDKWKLGEHQAIMNPRSKTRNTVVHQAFYLSITVRMNMQKKKKKD